MSNALVMPRIRARTWICQISIAPVNVRPNRVAAWSMANAWVTSRSPRLSNRSASTPPMGARNRAGRELEGDDRSDLERRPPSSRTSHGWETLCIQVPTRLTTWPDQ